jgi:hypothetical protein
MVFHYSMVIRQFALFTPSSPSLDNLDYHDDDADDQQQMDESTPRITTKKPQHPQD